MAEYKVRFRVKEVSMFGMSSESVEVYDVENAKQAIQKCHEDFNSQSATILEEVKLEILDVERV